MNRRNIKAVLSKKIKQWADSVDDDEIRRIIMNDIIVTGGCIASMLLKEKPKDFDIYLSDRSALIKLSNYYIKKFNEKDGVTNKASLKTKETLAEGKGDPQFLDECIEKLGDRVKIFIGSSGVASTQEYSEGVQEGMEDITEASESTDVKAKKEKYTPIFMSSNAITLSDKIQIVVRFFGDPAEIHKNYDFVHCTNYYLPGKDELSLKQEALEALLAKELIYQGSKYPLCSVIRTRKFIRRGFSINAGQYLKMMLQVSVLDLTDIDVLEDQLCGVDSAYFTVITESIRKTLEGNPDKEIDISYIAEIVDKVFG